MVADLLFSDMPRIYFQTCIAFCCVCLFHFNIFPMNTTCKKGKKTKNKYLNILLNITKNDLGTTAPYLAHIGSMVSLKTHIPVPWTPILTYSAVVLVVKRIFHYYPL